MECRILRDEMMDALYGEAPPEAAARLEEHLAVCAPCRDELLALKRLRRQLQAWPLPGPTRTRLPLPGLPRGLAAAAVLLVALGAALALSGSEARYSGGQWSLRLGRGGADVQQQLAEQERRHKAEIQAVKAALVSGSPQDKEALLQAVQDLIQQSEARQAVLLSASLADLAARAETQRRYDLARVSAGLSYLDGRTGQQVARTTELMGYVLQASQQR